MKDLTSFKEEIHKCSKCGLCQGECPVYKITGNDCSVSRGHFVMLDGLLKGDLKMTPKINHYLDLCLKCGACSKFCPSGIDVVDIIVSAKSEYFKTHKFERLISLFQKKIVFKLIPKFLSVFRPSTKSKMFEKKVLYFGGCGSKIKGDLAVVKLLNKINIEVVNPKFDCCGISLFMRGDLESFETALNNYVNTLKKYDIREVVTTCASCEKTLKDYERWCSDEKTKEFLREITVKNIYEYISENKFVLKKPITVTFHKPCNIENYDLIEKILKNTENLNYIEMKDFDKCCGLNALTKIDKYKITSKIFSQKRKNIINTDAKYVLTSCLGCEIALRAYSLGKYRVCDLVEFIVSNSCVL